jgi:hypothetical protein
LSISTVARRKVSRSPNRLVWIEDSEPVLEFGSQ